MISNGVDTKYFSAASDTELNPKFISGWLDQENNPVPDYLDFAKSVLRIPEAHEMISRYTVLDEDAKRLILLRPYQIHAIKAIREASKQGKSGFVWHTTGSGKTLTSYKATRNLLMDIPSIDKAIFLIDRKDLDTQTTMAFQAYANNDLVDVDETDNVNDLKKKLKSDDRQVIVTTIQKLHILITKKLKEDTSEYRKIKNLRIAFVVDECHRAVSPGTKRELERFFNRSLWYGFTGTPRFAENPYPQKGDLPRTTEDLLTGFDAPCMSTIFMDRQPMGPHDLIQAFSRTNRIFDKNKTYGQIVTFQAPILFKNAVDNAVKLYSAGGTKEALMAEWNEVEPAFRKALSALRVAAEKPEKIPAMSLKEKKIFAKMFQSFDSLFAQLKSFTVYDDSMLEKYGISEDEYDDYVGHYKNVVQEIKDAEGEKSDGSDGNEGGDDIEINQDYELMAYSNTKIDYEYIINLIQNIVTSPDEAEAVTPEERQKKIDEVKQYVEDLRKENPKVADIMSNLIEEIEMDDTKYRGQSILHIVENMKQDCIDRVISDFCITWYASREDVMYAATHYQDGEIPNESAIKMTVDYTSYKLSQEKVLPKFKYYTKMMAELRKLLDEEIKPLLTVA